MLDAVKLTDNQNYVLKSLSEAGRALSAYEILDQVRECGLRAPAQVYRALEKLIEVGLVHRLESLNAFVACDHKHDHAQAPAPAHAAAFAICETCGTVFEYDMPTEADALRASLAKDGFVANSMTVEVRGCCADCSR